MTKILFSIVLACSPVLAAPDTVDTDWANTAGSYFDSNAFGGPASMLVQPDGKLLLGSNWMSAQGGALFLPLTRFNLDGTVDNTFHADDTPDGGGSGIYYDLQGQPEVHGLALQSDGKILAVGCMQGMRDGATTGSSTKSLVSNGIVRITPGGDPDITFQSAGIDTEFIDEVITLPNDKIIIAGGFNAVRDQGGPFVTRYGIAQLNVDGSLDTSFSVNPADFGNITANTLFIRQVAPTPNGKLYVVGSAVPVGGTIFDETPVFARLNSDGSLDASFAPSYPSSVTSFFGVVVEPDGKILALGANGNSSSSTSYMNRFTSSGGSDGSFSLDASLTSVSARPLRRGPLGRYLLFKRDPVEGNSRLVRINANGSLDPAFNASGSYLTPPFGGATNAFFNQALASPTGKVYAGGGFDVINGEPTVKVVAFEGDEVPNSPGTIQLAAAAFSATEAEGNLLIPVVRIGGSTGAVAADYSFSTALGNATAGADFDATGGTISFAAGEAGTKYISVPLVEDSIVETLEVFTIDLGNATGAALGNPSQGFATIIDSDSPPLIIAQPMPIFVPPFGFFQISVGAISGKDPTTYQWLKNGSPIPGATSPLYFKTDANAANDDGEYCVIVTNPNGSTTSEKVNVVVKDPAELSFTASSADGVENEGSVTLTISRGGSSVNAVSVGLTLTNNTASPADYSISPAMVSWADGDTADKTITVTLTDDADVESGETFIATLTDYSADAAPGAITSLTFTILDDDSPLTITTQPDSQSLQEDEVLTLSVAATSQTPLSYQWLLDGAPVVGATDATLILDPVGINGGGIYTVEITNAAGTITSDAAIVEVTPAAYLQTNAPPTPDLDLAVYSITLIDNQTAWVSGNSSTLGQIIQKVSLNPAVAPVTITLNQQADQVILLPGGGVAARGNFTTVNGQSQSYVAKFRADGSLDVGQIVTGITNVPTAIAVDGAGRLLLAEGGSDLRRFESSGVLDTGFNPASFGSNAFIESVAVVGDSIYAGGRFTSSGSGTAGNYFTRLNSDGSRDESFTFPINQRVLVIVPLAAGRIAVLTQPSSGLVSQAVYFLSPAGVVERQFSSLGSLSRFDFDVDDNEAIYAPRANGALLTRLNDDGSFNANFGGFDSTVSAIEIDEAGRVWVGGLFSTLGGQPVPKLVILNGEPGELAIIEDPMLVSAEPGGSATFTVSSVSSGSMTYQWRKDGFDLPGETGESLVIDPVQSGNAGFYDVVVTNADSGFSLTSGEAELVVLGAPEIRESPPSATLIAGGDVTLEVGFFAREPVSLQWQKDGVDLPGETNSTLDLVAGELTDSGNYTLVVTNNFGAETSAPANIQFIPDPAGLVSGFIPMTNSMGFPGYVTPAPDGGALLGGGTLAGSFSRYLGRVDSAGVPDPVFLPGTSISSDSRSSGAVFDSAGLPVVVGNPRGFGFLINSVYRNVVKLNADGTFNEPFTGTVSNQSGFDFVAIDSSDRIYLVGANKLSRLNSDGTVDGTFPANFSGIPKAIELDALGRLLVLTTTGVVRFETDGSADTSFNFDSSIPINPAFVAFDISADGNLHVAAANSGSRRIYQVSDDGTLLKTLNNPGNLGSLNLLDFAVQENGKYLLADASSIGLNRVLPDGSPDPLWQIGSGFNSPVEVVEVTEDGRIWAAGNFSQFQGNSHYGYALLNGDPVDVVITSQPEGLNVDLGTSGSLSVAAIGFDGAPVTFQWQKDGVDLPGETGTTLFFASFDEGDEGIYEAVITNTNTGRERKSAAAVVTVFGAPELVSFTSEPQDLEIDDELSLSVEVTGAQTLDYQWQKNGDDIPGATNAAFSIPATVESDSGDYRVVVSNSFGTLTSEVVPVTVVFSPAAVNPGDRGLVFNGTVESILSLADGRTLVGGSFSRVTFDGVNYNVDELALLNADGSLDTNFDLNPSGAVYSLARDRDGGILVGGRFVSIGGQSKARVARLKPDFTLDLDFGSNVGPNGDVYTFEASGDGRYYVGGIFNQWDGNPGSGYLVRLDSNGIYDSSFAPEGLNTTEKVIPLPDGQVIAAGAFTANGLGRIARFNEDGTVDSTYPVTSNRYLFDIAFQPDGKLVAVGQNGRIIRYHIDGSQDFSFAPTADSRNIKAVAIEASGKILLGGLFTTVNGEDVTGLVRLNADGSTDESFDVRDGANGSVEDIAIQPLGRIWIGGSHSSYRGESTGRLTLLNGDPLDLAIVQGPGNAEVDPGTNATFSVVAAGTDTLNYQWSRNGIPLTDGGDISGATTDTLTIANAEDADEDSYEVVVTHSVTMESLTSSSASLVVLGAPEILAQPEGVTTENGLAATFEILARGASSLTYQWFRDGDPLSDGETISGATTPELTLSDLEVADSSNLFVRMTNGLGSIDSEVVSLLVEKLPASRDRSVVLPTFNSTVRALYPNEDGSFSTVTHSNGSAGLRYLARILADGTPDPDFAQTNSGSVVQSIDRDAVGSYLVAGGFTRLRRGSDFPTRNRVARILADGSVDAAFDPGVGPNNTVQVVKALPDGKVLIGGNFTNVSGEPGTAYIARLNVDGSVDDSFVSQATGSVDDIALVGNDYWLSGGSSYDGNFYHVRIDSTGAVLGSFGYDGTMTANKLIPTADGGVVLGSTTYPYLQKVDGSGQRDTNWPNLLNGGGPNNRIYELARLGNDRSVVAGTFFTYSGISAPNIMVVDANGNPEPDFLPGAGFNGSYPLIVKTDSLGRIWCGGSFTSYDGETASRMVVLNGYEPSAIDPFEAYVDDLPVDQQDAGDDPDRDGQSNLVEFAYGTLAEDATSRTQIKVSSNLAASAEINSLNAGSNLPAGESYYTVTYRFPYDSQGVTITAQATLNPGTFNDGSAQIIPLGDPVDDGDYFLQRYYVTPGQSGAIRGFTRLKLER